jgi:hypothetical protein
MTGETEESFNHRLQGFLELGVPADHLQDRMHRFNAVAWEAISKQAAKSDRSRRPSAQPVFLHSAR